MQLFTTVEEPAGVAPLTHQQPPAPAASDGPAAGPGPGVASAMDTASSSSSSSGAASPLMTNSPATSAISVSNSSTMSATAGNEAAAALSAAGSGVQSPVPSSAAAAAAGPGGRGRLYSCNVKGWPPVMRLLVEHLEQELPFSRDPFYIQLEAMAGARFGRRGSSSSSSSFTSHFCTSRQQCWQQQQCSCRQSTLAISVWHCCQQQQHQPWLCGCSCSWQLHRLWFSFDWA